MICDLWLKMSTCETTCPSTTFSDILKLCSLSHLNFHAIQLDILYELLHAFDYEIIIIMMIIAHGVKIYLE